MLTADCKFLISSVLLIKVSVSPAGCAPLPAYLLQYKYKLSFCSPSPVFALLFVIIRLRYLVLLSRVCSSLLSARICKVCTVSAKSAQYLHNSVICNSQSADHVWRGHCRWSPLPTADTTLDTGHSAADVLILSLSLHLASNLDSRLLFQFYF